jgi:hypothetical protein
LQFHNPVWVLKTRTGLFLSFRNRKAPADGHGETEAVGYDAQRKAEECSEWSLTYGKREDASSLGADSQRCEQTEPNKAEAGPCLPDPLLGVTLERDVQFEVAPIFRPLAG